MRTLLFTFCLCLALATGCRNPVEDHKLPNKLPSTQLWLTPAPDSSIAAGHSRQTIHWTGDDPDGLIRGFLIASGKLFSDPRHPAIDNPSIEWHWTAARESVIAFPLLSKLDTFQIAVRAVDNTFIGSIDGSGTVRLLADKRMYWDKNANGVFDSSDVWLENLYKSTDPKGAILAFPVLNQAPTVSFFNPIDSTIDFAQPETTYTAATFAWHATDPDGDQTVVQYDIALNDTAADRIVTVPSSIKMVSVVAPRQRTDGLTGKQEVLADLWSGTFLGNHKLIGTIGHLRINDTNKLYVRARDIAGAASLWARLPGDSTQYWYVKNPVGHILVVDDYAKSNSDHDSVLAFYRNLPELAGHPGVDVLNIDLGIKTNDKAQSETQTPKLGKLVPQLIDPALIFTLHLYDMVIWFSDMYPSMTVAQVPLYEYVRDASHHGKVIYSTMFKTVSDPRALLNDFVPIDSISSVDLTTNGRLMPTFGDTQLPDTFTALPATESPEYPPLKFKQLTGASHNYSVYFRPIYKQTGSKYIYQMQSDTRSPIRYGPVTGFDNLNDIATIGAETWVCGDNGAIFHSGNNGRLWTRQNSGTSLSLLSVHFFDADNGWIVGSGGAILHTINGGATWSQKFGWTLDNLSDIFFLDRTYGYSCGTTGLILRTTDAGKSWLATNTHLKATIRSVCFSTPANGIAVGDSGIVLHSVDSGKNWTSLSRVVSKALFSCAFITPSHCIAVGLAGKRIESTDGGATWKELSSFSPNADLYTVSFTDALNGWSGGYNGSVFHTTDGGTTWTKLRTGIETISTGLAQIINGIAIGSDTSAVGIGTGGIILKSPNLLSPNLLSQKWTLQPSIDLNIALIDGQGQDGKRSFVFFGLPLHLLSGNKSTMIQFFNYIYSNEFGL